MGQTQPNHFNEEYLNSLVTNTSIKCNTKIISLLTDYFLSFKRRDRLNFLKFECQTNYQNFEDYQATMLCMQIYELECQVKEAIRFSHSRGINIESVSGSNFSQNPDIEFEEFYVEDNKLLTMEVRGGQLLEIEVVNLNGRRKHLEFGDLSIKNGFKILAYGQRNPFVPSCTVFYLQKELASFCRPIFQKIKKGSLQGDAYKMKIRPVLKLSSTVKELDAIFNM